MSATNSFLKALFEPLPRPGFIIGLIAVILLQVGMLLMISEQSPLFLQFFEFYTYPDGPSGRIVWYRVIGSMFFLSGCVLFLYYLFKQIRRTASSPDERASDDTAIEIKNLRREFSRLKSGEFNYDKIETRIQEILTSKQKTPFDLTDLADENWAQIILTGRQRLLGESERLSARSRLNLTWGVLISSLAVFYLSYFVFFARITIVGDGPYSFASYYGPRLGLILIVQILASFFLRMYVGNEKSIQKNKNEVTNLELRLAAISLVDDQKERAKLAQKLISEERNFVVDKKQKSVLPETNTEMVGIIGSVQKLIKEAKS